MKKLVVVTLALAVTAFVILSAGVGAQELAPTQQEDKIAPDVRHPHAPSVYHGAPLDQWSYTRLSS